MQRSNWASNESKRITRASLHFANLQRSVDRTARHTLAYARRSPPTRVGCYGSRAEPTIARQGSRGPTIARVCESLHLCQEPDVVSSPPPRCLCACSEHGGARPSRRRYHRLERRQRVRPLCGGAGRSSDRGSGAHIRRVLDGRESDRGVAKEGSQMCRGSRPGSRRFSFCSRRLRTFGPSEGRRLGHEHWVDGHDRPAPILLVEDGLT